MTASLKASTYLVDGTDLEVPGVALTHEGAGFWDGMTEEVVVDRYPGRDGGSFVGGGFPPSVHSTMFRIDAAGYDAVDSAFRSLRRRCKPGRTVTLTKQVPDPEGTAANVNLAATARRQGDRFAWLTKNAAQVDVDWLIADGAWYGSSVAIASIAGTQAVVGDVRTRKMTVTLAAGAARTVTNTTNGYWFTFSTAVPTGGILVDVAARTATAITGGADYSAYLSWGKTAPFQLERGSNVLTVSTGSASISYQPAYL